MLKKASSFMDAARVLLIGVLLLVFGGFGCAGRPQMPNAPAISTGGTLSDAGARRAVLLSDRYRTVLVADFADAHGAPGAGALVAKMVRDGLEAMDFRVLDPVRAGDDRQVAQLGREAGAQAVIVGRVLRWKRKELEVSHLMWVSLEFKMLAVETGAILFKARGSYPHPIEDGDPIKIARALLATMLDRFGMAAGVLGPGVIGLAWDMDPEGIPVVTTVMEGLPASRAGIRPGDKILSCHGIASSEWTTQRQRLKACAALPGRPLTLAVSRRGESFLFTVTPVHRVRAMQAYATDR